MSDVATQWGLPEGFKPVRFPVNDDIKQLVREIIEPGEAIIACVANEGDTIALLATNRRVLTIRSGANAGVTGFTTRDFTWEALTDMRLQSNPTNVAISLHFQSKDNGRTAEVGQKAKFAKPAIDKVMPFETNAGTQVFEAIHAVWHHNHQR
ncbi:MAG TPA: hypothetical protein VF681_12985 [Abditibacteriaceae bacterium]|jgi:hypothetical protein